MPIEAAMVFPSVEDEGIRRRAMAHGQSRAAIEMMRSGAINSNSMTSDEVADLIEAALEADPSDTAKENARSRYFDGAAVGMTVLDILFPHDGQKLSLAGAKERLGDRIGRIRKAGQGEKVTEERWRLFRPAAHLWAASMHFLMEDPARPAPFSYHKLAEFIALADFILDLGASHRVEGKRPTAFSANTLLDKGQAWHPDMEIIRTLPVRWQLIPS